MISRITGWFLKKKRWLWRSLPYKKLGLLLLLTMNCALGGREALRRGVAVEG